MDPSTLPDLGLHLTSTHVLITGAAGAIGQIVVRHFLASGALVTGVDIVASIHSSPPFQHPNLLWLHADISDETHIKNVFEAARKHRDGRAVECCIALAGLDLSYLPRQESMADMDVEGWRNVLRVNAEGTFLTAREWLRGIREAVAVKGDAKEEGDGGLKNVGLIMIGSEAGSFGVRGNPEYSASKSAVQYGLLESLKGDVVRVCKGARVNAVAPGPVDTVQFRKECKEDPEELWMSAQATTAQGKPVSMDSVAKTILFLASESWSDHVHGQVIHVNSGKQGKVEWKPGEYEKHLPS